MPGAICVASTSPLRTAARTTFTRFDTWLRSNSINTSDPGAPRSEAIAVEIWAPLEETPLIELITSNVLRPAAAAGEFGCTLEISIVPV